MTKHDLSIEPPIMNAAGALGFSADLHSEIDWHGMGAFVTNPTSLARRTPAHGRRFTSFPGGFLLHTGYPNPGFSQVLRRYARQWNRSPVPVIVHLLVRSTDEVAQMVRRLEMVEGVAGVEIGLPGDASAGEVAGFTRAAAGELAVIMRLPLERASELAQEAVLAGAAAISLAPPRGAYPVGNGEILQGRMYGPAVLPLALHTIKELVRQGIPTIGAGGVYNREHVEAMLTAGALAVQLDSLLWRSGYRPSVYRRQDGNHQN